MPIAHTTKLIEQRARRLVRLRRILLVLGPLCMGAAFWNIAEYADSHDLPNLLSGGLALIASLLCAAVAAKLKLTLRDMERARRMMLSHYSNGSHQ